MTEIASVECVTHIAGADGKHREGNAYNTGGTALYHQRVGMLLVY